MLLQGNFFSKQRHFAGVGTGGSEYDGETQDYPEFHSENFHQPPCPVNVSDY